MAESIMESSGVIVIRIGDSSYAEILIQGQKQSIRAVGDSNGEAAQIRNRITRCEVGLKSNIVSQRSARKRINGGASYIRFGVTTTLRCGRIQLW